MLYKCYYGLICVAGLFKLIHCQRTVQEIDPALGKKFVVYFVESPSAKKEYDTWLCGGALVSPTQILTAAACLVEAEKIYAIAGYQKYIGPKDIENDQCTKARKQRVVKILIPTEYKLAYENPAQWINVDVGVAIVEKPYNFSDLSYRVHCSYEPQPIFVNFEHKYEIASTRAVSFGWSSTNTGMPGSTQSQLLQEASTIIVDKKVCSSPVNAQEIIHIIEKYLLCAANNKEDVKNMQIEERDTRDCKIRRYDLTKATDVDGCLEDDFGFRKKYDKNKTNIEEIITRNYTEISQGNYTELKNFTNTGNYLYTSVNSRRSSSVLGPCQNGHGCPLIKWVGDKEVVIGIASNVNSENECNGPFLYVSTAATSKIIKCLLETNSITRKFCNEEIRDKKYEVQEIEINWPNYFKKVPIVVQPIIKRSVDEAPLIARPTRDIVSRTNNKSNAKALNQQSFNPQQHKLTRSLSNQDLPAQPYNRIQGQSYQQPQDAMPMDIKQRQQYGLPLLQQQQQQQQQQLQQMPPSMNQPYEPYGPQYGPSPDQQYELPPGQEYDTSPSQQYDPQLRQPYESSNGQQYEQQPEQQQYDPQPGQEYEQQMGQQYGQSSDPQTRQPSDPQSGQPSDPLSGQPSDPQTRQPSDPQTGQPSDPQIEQQYDPQSGQPYAPSEGQRYDPQDGQQYEMPSGQQYEPQSDQLYQSPPDQQYESMPNQQNMPPPNQGYEPPTGQQYEPPSDQPVEAALAQAADPSMGQQYEPIPNPQYQQTSGQYEPAIPQQYEQQPSNAATVSNSQYQQQSGQQPQAAQQYGPPQGQQYNKPPGQLQDQSQGQSQSQPLRQDPQQGQQKDQQQGLNQQLQTRLQAQSQMQPDNMQSYGQQGQQNSRPHLQKPQEQSQSQQHQPAMQLNADSYIKQEEPQLSNQNLLQSTTDNPSTQDTTSSDITEHTPQSFDQIFSELHNLPNEATAQLNNPGHEETFEQLYSHLHEPSFDLPHELTVPQYNGPPDEPFEENEQHAAVEETSNNQHAETLTAEQANSPPGRSDDVRIRPQMPIDYQNDYFFYSYRRNGSQQ